MACSFAQIDNALDSVFKSLLKTRSRPYVVIFDANANMLFGEARALHMRTRAEVRALEQEATELIRRKTDGEAITEEIVGPINGVILRVVPLNGAGGDLYAVFFEQEARREDLKQAVTRFSFTRREVEILDRILDGMNASEIADDLHIAEVTVFDHFKHISYKTKARNRADMLAKIFNWQPELKSSIVQHNGIDRRVTRTAKSKT